MTVTCAQLSYSQSGVWRDKTHEGLEGCVPKDLQGKSFEAVLYLDFSLHLGRIELLSAVHMKGNGRVGRKGEC